MRRAIELVPQNTPAYLTLARTYRVDGRSQDAIALLDRPEFRQAAEMVSAYAQLGRRQNAEVILRGVEAGRTDAIGAAWLSFALGDLDRGFDWLGKVVDRRDSRAPAIGVGPQWASVRADPRVAVLLKRLNLPR